MPSTNSSDVSIVCDSSTVITPSLPTFSIASAMIPPMAASPLAEIALFEVGEWEVGGGGRGERRPLSSLIDALRLSTLEIANELRQGRLGLAEEDVIGLG